MHDMALALLADLFNPLWAGVSLWLCFTHRHKTEQPRKLIVRQIAFFTLGLLVIVGLAWMDQRLGLWPQYSLDYSTHTALALLFTLFITSTWGSGGWGWWGVWVLYTGLMVWLEYHSLADILTTAFIVGLLLLPLSKILPLKPAL